MSSSRSLLPSNDKNDDYSSSIDLDYVMLEIKQQQQQQQQKANNQENSQLPANNEQTEIHSSKRSINNQRTLPTQTSSPAVTTTDINNTYYSYNNITSSSSSSSQDGVKHLFRLMLTGVAALLVCAALLTVSVSSHYKVVIGVFWILLIGTFLGLMYIVQNAVQTGRRPFHPIVHTVADWIIDECTNFVDDWKHIDEILLLTNADHTNVSTSIHVPSSSCPEQTNSQVNFVSLTEGNTPINNNTNSDLDRVNGKANEQNVGQRRKSKSILFRTVVQPFIGLRNKRRQQYLQKHGRNSSK
jgi:hypothetical protein